jgi:hypothetical protein
MNPTWQTADGLWQWASGRKVRLDHDSAWKLLRPCKDPFAVWPSEQFLVPAWAGVSACLSLQIEDHQESLAASLHLLASQEARRFGEAVEIDGGKLIAHDQRLPTSQFH